MIKQNVIDSNETCTDCFKNSLLIKKYEDLIHLYKKKQEKLNRTSTSRMSNGPTSSSLDQQSSEVPCSILFETLSVLYRKRCERFFKPLFPKSCKKFVLLSISNKIEKSAKKRAFQKLASNTSGKLDKVVSIIKRKRYSILSEAFTVMKKHNGIPVLEEIILETLSKPESIDKNIQVFFESLRHNIFAENKLPCELGRKLVEQEIKNQNLILENQILRESLLEASRRQTKENQKKKESLEMLAEEISEKNEEIESLKRTIKAYEETYKGFNNVLDEDIIELRKDVDRLESVNERLNDDLNKLKQKTEENKNKIKILEEKNFILEKENEEIRKDGLKEQIKWQKATKVEAEFNKLITVLDKKLKRLNIYEKEIIKNNTKSETLSKETQNFKAEIILLFLANLSIPEYKLHAENLFDNQEKEFLYEHKNNWFHKTKQPNQQEEIKIEGCDISEIEMKGGNLNSIFEALDSPRERSESSPVMRMLELEIEKNKQISKISELKEKLLHVRVIILKLLKSLELQSGIKIEVEGILRVIFDMFEYSEEERESIFVKKRKLFGLI